MAPIADDCEIDKLPAMTGELESPPPLLGVLEEEEEQD